MVCHQQPMSSEEPNAQNGARTAREANADLCEDSVS